MARVANVKKTDYGQQEAIALMGGEMREWAIDTLEVELDKAGAARALRVVDLDWSHGKPERLDDTEREYPARSCSSPVAFYRPRA